MARFAASGAAIRSALAAMRHAQTHLEHPGPPARVTSQEKGRCYEVSSSRLRHGRQRDNSRGTIISITSTAPPQNGQRRPACCVGPGAVSARPVVPGSARPAPPGSGWPSSRNGGCARSPWEGRAQKAPDELFGGQRHLAFLAAVGVVLPAEGHVAVLHAEQPMIGDGYAVCVTCQIVQHVFRAAERLLDIDHPVVPVQEVEEARERARFLKPRQDPWKASFCGGRDTSMRR